MDQRELGRQLRTLRTTAGRTVASVAADAGLSVPYVANLENGRGNPTATALGRLATALGTQLTITFSSLDGVPPIPPEGPPPRSLVRLSRTHRLRRDVRVLAESLGHPPQELATRITRALAPITQVIDRDLVESDWWRLLDALLLVGAHPNRQRGDRDRTEP
jgi:transcriptional regulator with XRE-family HTH domain